MSTFSNDKYKELVNNFNLLCKRVLKKELSKNKCKHIEYATVLTEAYNDVTKYIFEFYGKFDTEDKTYLKSNWVQLRDKLNQCFSKILQNYSLPTELCEKINLRIILKDNFTEAELSEYGKTT